MLFIHLVMVLLTSLTEAAGSPPAEKCAMPPTRAEKDGISKDDEVEVYAVAFEHVLKTEDRARLFFLGTGKDGDPPDRVLKLLSHLKLRLRKGSRAERTTDGAGHIIYVDRDSKEPGTTVRLLGIQRAGEENMVEVKAVYHINKSSGYTEVLRLKKKGGQWSVSGSRAHGEF